MFLTGATSFTANAFLLNGKRTLFGNGRFLLIEPDGTGLGMAGAEEGLALLSPEDEERG